MMAENLPNLQTGIDSQIETQQTQAHATETMPRHITKLLKTSDKRKTLEAPREKAFCLYREIKIWMTADFSSETMQVKGQWHNIFKVRRQSVSLEFHTWQNCVSNNGSRKNLSPADLHYRKYLRVSHRKKQKYPTWESRSS